MSLLPGVRDMTPFGRQKLASHVPGECCFLSNMKNQSVVQAELIPGYLSCILESGDLEFPWDLTITSLEAVSLCGQFSVLAAQRNQSSRGRV